MAIEQFDRWLNFEPVEQDQIEKVKYGRVQYMVSLPNARSNTDVGTVKIRWQADTTDEGVYLTFYGYRRAIPERIVEGGDAVLEEFVLAAAGEFATEYDYYPLNWGYYTEERMEPLVKEPEVDPTPPEPAEPVDPAPLEPKEPGVEPEQAK